MMQIDVTEAAVDLLRELKARYGEDLLFHQSGGCCDGSAPMCFRADEFLIGDSDVKVGVIDNVPFYMKGDQYKTWQHTDLIIDAVSGNGGMFSLDNGTGRRFLTRSEICAI